MKLYNQIYDESLAEAIYNEYQQWIQQVDDQILELENCHSAYLKCKSGCAGCCQVDRTVNSIEAHILYRTILHLDSKNLKQLKKNLKKKNHCPMLNKKTCAIYKHRPILCRTHGLPLFYVQDDDNTITFCQKNFKKLPENFNFTSDTLLNMETLNSKLREFDKNWVENVNRETWTADRIPIRDILLPIVN